MQSSLAVRLAPLFASELLNARPFWRPLFVWLVFQQFSDPTCPVECIISDVVFGVFLQYTRPLSRQLTCSQLEVAFARASFMSDHFCPSSVVYLLCGWCDVTRKHDEPRLCPHYLPRQKALTNHQNSLEYTQQHIPWLLKCLHYNIKLLYGQKKHYSGRKACVAMVMTGVSKIRPKRNILHLFHRPTNGFLLFSAKWTSLWNQTFLPSERNERSEFLNWPTDYDKHLIWSLSALTLFEVSFSKSVSLNSSTTKTLLHNRKDLRRQQNKEIIHLNHSFRSSKFSH